ncbi:MAG: hypothetical protein LWX70_09265 [Sphingobacteriia bacterium]|nr:hypothetical protein [Sphingobacteriia bacterium]
MKEGLKDISFRGNWQQAAGIWHLATGRWLVIGKDSRLEEFKIQGIQDSRDSTYFTAILTKKKMVQTIAFL